MFKDLACVGPTSSHIKARRYLKLCNCKTARKITHGVRTKGQMSTPSFYRDLLHTCSMSPCQAVDDFLLLAGIIESRLTQVCPKT